MRFNHLYYQVEKVALRGDVKTITFSEIPEKLQVSRWAGVREGDTIEISEKEISIVCQNGKAQLLPIYLVTEQIKVGNLQLEFLVKEMTEPEEFAAYKSLTQFHYRNRALVGRKVRLIIRNYHPLYPKIVGYIELTTPFFMNKARAMVFDAPFRLNGTSWESWDVDTRRKYTNAVVRIARCVVYPEFRGLGLGQILVKHAAEFARNHWQVGSLKPYFLEISADMLKFVPFAQKAGMIFIGETEGNINRVARDMAYLLEKMPDTLKYSSQNGDLCGFLDQQMARASKAADLRERMNWTIEDLKGRLNLLKTKVTIDDHLLFHGIVSFPKPTYLQGLNKTAEDFVNQRVVELGVQNGYKTSLPSIEPVKGEINLKNVSLTYNSQVRRTWQTQAIAKAFDIVPEEISHTIIDNLSFTIKPGQIVLLTGTSGSGKSTLLKLLGKKISADVPDLIQLPENFRPGFFEPIRSRKALIECFAKRSVDKALQLLGVVGLSDALVYLKRFSELSNGQQYRAMLAQLLSSEYNVWLADEFCAALDPLTANLVASRLQKVARKVKAVLIVASSQPENFITALNPDLVINLSTALEHQVISGSDFRQSFSSSTRRFDAPSLRIAPEYLQLIKTGQKISTIRKGRKKFSQEIILLRSTNHVEAVRIQDIKYLKFSELTELDARADGFQTLDSLCKTLIRHYPDLRETSILSVINFKRFFDF